MVPCLRSPSITNILFFLMAKLMAMFMERNDLPLPGLNEVITNTFCLSSLFVMKSILERSTRNASLMISRLPSFTTIALISGCVFLLNPNFFFVLKYWGISPMRGMLRFSRSLRPRTLVFIFSFVKIITAGMSSPITNATRRIFIFRGAVGNILPRGAVITRVL